MKRVASNIRPYLIIICGLGILLIATSLPGIYYYNKTFREDAKIPNQQEKVSTVELPETIIQQEQNVESSNPTKNHDDTVAKKTSVAQQTTPQQSSDTTASSNAPDIQKTEISLYINNSSKGKINVAPGSNQCSVLSQALKQGAIQSLDMRYSEHYQTMAVYSINGLGEPSQIWWTYSVNGKPPPFGCSKMTTRNGDQVNWQYIK